MNMRQRNSNTSKGAIHFLFVWAMAITSPVQASHALAGLGILVYGVFFIFCGIPIALWLLVYLVSGTRRRATRTQRAVGVLSGVILTLSLAALAVTLAQDATTYPPSRADRTGATVSGVLAILTGALTSWSILRRQKHAWETLADEEGSKPSDDQGDGA